MPELTCLDIDNLKHMLGATKRYKKSQWGFRNRFLAGDEDMESMKRLESNGLVREVKSVLFENLFIATENGCNRLGFNKKQIANAMNH